VTDRGEIRQHAAPAITHHADASSAGRMLAEKIHCRGDVVGDLIVIHFAAQRSGALELGFLQLHAGLGAPEEVGADGGELASRQKVADFAHALIDPEDFLENDDAGALALAGQGHVGGHCTARYGDSNGHKAL